MNRIVEIKKKNARPGKATEYSPSAHSGMHVVVLLSGWSCSGKDTVGHLLASHGFERFAFADVLKHHVAQVQGVSFKMLHTEAGKATLAPDGTGRTMRQVLIDTGADLRKAKGADYFAAQVAAAVAKVPRAVITDWRFVDELEMLQSALKATHALLTVRVVRRGQEDSPVADAITEHQLDAFAFDFVLDNPGTTLEELTPGVVAIAARANALASL